MFFGGNDYLCKLDFLITMDENIIPIESYIEDFKHYLNNNSRCIFSARFGEGKSFFIQNFIDRYKEDFLFIPIYPINYQVESNKDIFEYIKRDILIKLLTEDDIILDDTVIKPSLVLYSFFNHFKSDIALDLLSCLPDLNLLGTEVKLGTLFDKVKLLKQKFKDYNSKFNSDAEDIKDYLTSTKLNQGIYEFDPISELICDLILDYKKNEGKDTVLIIEDLDRIDPEHIFRILNVFSAHLDRHNITIEEYEKTQNNNKFCFDKIITVCDYNNIRNIYSHVYGKLTDFSGYISKFSDNIPFYYTLRKYLFDYIKDCIPNSFANKYPLSTKLLIDKILDENKLCKENLREIKNRIGSVNSLIKRKKIQIKTITPKSYFINSDSDMLLYLALLKSFNISLDSIIDNFHEIKFKEQNEIFKMLNSFCVLVSYFDKDIKLSIELDNEKTNLIMIYKESESSVLRRISYDVIDKNIIKNMSFPINPYGDSEDIFLEKVKSHFFEIIDFIAEEFIC